MCWPLNVAKLCFIGCIVAVDVQRQIDFKMVNISDSITGVQAHQLTFEEFVALVPVDDSFEVEE